jgi:hypothetical protein
MRYGIALLAAVLIIGGIGLFIRQTRQQVDELIRQAPDNELKAEGAEEGLSETPVKSATSGDLNMRVPAALQARLDLARLLATTWFLWVPCVAVLCLGYAMVASRILQRKQ